jgi:hypothetical protein
MAGSPEAARAAARERAVARVRERGVALAWEKQVLSARGFKRVGRRSEYAV